MPKTTFLQNAGLETARPKRSKAAAAVAARVQELEGQLDVERHIAEELRDKVEHLIKQTEDADSARMKHSDEVETLKSSFQETKASLEETQALLRGLLNLNKI
ncbi:hypothetical protein PR202_ga31586 [Eleusine coracana subsp. coracana]|uniref:Uncharacterized protein n=1 Tax=Eleusine coracana subsp. coracana TaxID=191504 RepID=A0AAV5DSC9_ELECO|nr:hypothetical protein PR202_ga31586 [Eleusine coracana subsp. coracana]